MPQPSLHILYDVDLDQVIKALQNKQIHFACLAGNKETLSYQILRNYFDFSEQQFINMVQLIEKNAEAGALFPRVYMTMLPALLLGQHLTTDAVDKVWTDLIMQANEKYFKTDKLYILIDCSDVMLREKLVRSLQDFVEKEGTFIRFLREITLVFRV
jgi:hypothetical protein